MTDLPRTALDRAMRSVLAQLELISNGTTTSYNTTGGATGENPDPRPRGGDGAPHLYWAVRYSEAADDDSRRDVIDGAQAEWKQLTGRGTAGHIRPSESSDDMVARVLSATRGWAPDEVANHPQALGWSARTLRRHRRGAGLDTETGLPLERITTAGIGDRRARARELRGKGYSVRGIALLLGVSQGTVSGDLEEAA